MNTKHRIQNRLQKYNFKKLLLIVLASFSAINISFAQQSLLSSLNGLVGGASSIAVNVAGLLMTVSFIAFMVIVIAFILKRRSGDANGAKQALSMLWWAVFAMFVMVSVWGIVAFLSGNLGIGVGGCIDKPSPIPGQPAVRVCNNGAAAPSATGVSNGAANGATASPITNSQGNTVTGPGSACGTYTNEQCKQYAGCKIDSSDGCVSKS